MVSIANFFEGKCVFVTGATGFLGKVLIEKLLWACENIDKIYILIRSKNGLHQKKRLEDIISLPVFDRLRNRNPKCFEKLVPILGDVMEENLGIDDEDRKLLESSVSIVFHAASSVRFDDTLKRSVFINVRGTRDVMDLVKNMPKLEICVYVSTSYCICDRKVIDERVYPSNIDWDVMIKIAETVDEHALKILEPKILMNKPNTYTFTKFLAENVVKDYSANLPCIIFRPSIVTSCYNEPVVGWIENLNGIMGFAAGFSSGVLHAIYGNLDNIPDLIPCDRLINGLIISAWYYGAQQTAQCQVINAANGGKKKLNGNFIGEWAIKALNIIPLDRMLWYPTFIMSKNKFIYHLMVVLTHILPALFFDCILAIKKEKFSLMKLYRKIYIANNALAYFTCNEWMILTENYDQLDKYVLNEDRTVFKYTIDDVDKSKSVVDSIFGMKRYVFKDDFSQTSIASAKRQFNRMFWLDRITRGTLLCICLWFIYEYIRSYSYYFLK